MRSSYYLFLIYTILLVNSLSAQQLQRDVIFTLSSGEVISTNEIDVFLSIEENTNYLIGTKKGQNIYYIYNGKRFGPYNHFATNGWGDDGMEMLLNERGDYYFLYGRNGNKDLIYLNTNGKEYGPFDFVNNIFDYESSRQGLCFMARRNDIYYGIIDGEKFGGFSEILSYTRTTSNNIFLSFRERGEKGYIYKGNQVSLGGNIEYIKAPIENKNNHYILYKEKYGHHYLIVNDEKIGPFEEVRNFSIFDEGGYVFTDHSENGGEIKCRVIINGRALGPFDEIVTHNFNQASSASEVAFGYKWNNELFLFSEGESIGPIYNPEQRQKLSVQKGGYQYTNRTKSGIEEEWELVIKDEERGIRRYGPFKSNPDWLVTGNGEIVIFHNREGNLILRIEDKEWPLGTDKLFTKRTGWRSSIGFHSGVSDRYSKIISRKLGEFYVHQNGLSAGFAFSFVIRGEGYFLVNNLGVRGPFEDLRNVIVLPTNEFAFCELDLESSFFWVGSQKIGPFQVGSKSIKELGGPKLTYYSKDDYYVTYNNGCNGPGCEKQHKEKLLSQPISRTPLKKDNKTNLEKTGCWTKDNDVHVAREWSADHCSCLDIDDDFGFVLINGKKYGKNSGFEYSYNEETNSFIWYSLEGTQLVRYSYYLE